MQASARILRDGARSTLRRLDIHFANGRSRPPNSASLRGQTNGNRTARGGRGQGISGRWATGASPHCALAHGQQMRREWTRNRPRARIRGSRLATGNQRPAENPTCAEACFVANMPGAASTIRRQRPNNNRAPLARRRQQPAPARVALRSPQARSGRRPSHGP